MSDAGRELDALVAEKVMGWRWRAGRGLRMLVAPDDESWDDLTGGERVARDYARDVPCYSTEITAAWLLVDALYARDLALTVEAKPKALAVAWITSGMIRWAEHYAETVPLAICRAALATVEVEPSPPAGLDAMRARVTECGTEAGEP